MPFTNLDPNPDVKRFCVNVVTGETDDGDKLDGSCLSCKDLFNCWLGVPTVRGLLNFFAS